MIRTPIEIQIWPVSRLKPYARNSRLHSDSQIAQLVDSIREFGFTNPILVATDDGIIAGHGRLAAAMKLGLKQVPVIVLDHLTDVQRRAYIIADNKIALNSSWDLDQLAEEMIALDGDGFDLTLTGFTLPEIENLTVGLEDESDEEEEDDEPSRPAQKVTCPECSAEFVPEKRGR